MQTLALLFLMLVGIVVCAVSARALVLQWRFPWREALMYFGVIPYPHEAPVARREHR
jgi:hypothetical protein